MGSFLRFMAKHAGKIVFVCAGVVIGLLLRLPFNWNLADTTANLLGGVVGAAASVAGAMLVVNRQISEEDRRRDSESILQRGEQMRQLMDMRRALGNALYSDLRTVTVLLDGQRKLASGADFDGRALKEEQDFVDWCNRMELMPMSSFDRFSHLLHHLGDISPVLIHAYADIHRTAAVFFGQRSQRRSPRDCVEFVSRAALTLPILQGNINRAMEALEPYTSFEIELETG